MSFCRIGAGMRNEGFTIIDNTFLRSHLTNAPAECSRVYIYGLFLAQSDMDNSLQSISSALSISESDLLEIYAYWQEKGLVNLVSIQPMQVVYLPVTTAIGSMKKYDIGKYTDFNISIQSLFEHRTITMNEYTEYYTVIESFHMTPPALLDIARYAIGQKGNTVGHRYITTIAKNWASSGVLNEQQVSQKIADLGIYDDQLTSIMHALSSRAKPTIDDKDMLDKWIKTLGYDMDTILAVASSLKKRKMKSTIMSLDNVLNRYYELGLLDIISISTYEDEKLRMTALTRSLVKTLGLYYEDVSSIVDNYILPYMQMGYDDAALLMIAEFCFRQSIRTLVGYDEIVKKLSKLGIISTASFEQYLSDIIQTDSNIKNILDRLHLSRRVNDSDRALYRRWTSEWNIIDELIDYAIELSADRPNATTYMNKILSNWHSAHVNSIDAAKAFIPDSISKPKTASTNFAQKEYTKDQLNSLFNNLSEVEV